MTDPKANQPDLDLIQMVQRARMLHDATAKPSEISGNYWIEAKPHGDTPAITSHTGDWQIVTTLREVDALWEIIKQATERGQLGYKAKVSTAPGQADSQMRLILVCTRDADDADDVQRVYEALQHAGITAAMRYQRR